jgi:hypothetical protein
MPQNAFLRVFVAAAILATPLAPHAGTQNLTGLRPSWSDLETWSRKGMDIRETEMGIGLHLSGSGGTMMLSFSAKMNSRSPNASPAEVQIMVGAPFNSANIVRPRILGFVVEIENLAKKTIERKTIDISSSLALDNPAPGAVPEAGIATMTIAQFADIVKAKTAAARIFGVDVVFREDQLKAVRAFGERIRLRLPAF